MITPNNSVFEPYKHLRIVKAFMVWQIALLRNVVFKCGRFRTFRPGSGSDSVTIVTAYGQLALNHLRLSVLNEIHTNSCTGLRLLVTLLTRQASEYNTFFLFFNVV